MCPGLMGHVVIEGQRFAESDETTFLLASDILQGVSDDLDGLADARVDEAGAEHAGRFGPIAEIMELLETRLTHQESLRWVVLPNETLGARPLDLVTAGQANDVLRHIERAAL